MTEEEAKKKWCPYGKRQQLINDPFHCCIGSDCMMWRVSHYIGSNKMVPVGYCGLAGKP
jgi:hypothetical protein